MRLLSSSLLTGRERIMLDVTTLGVLTEATMPALTKLCYTVKVQLEIQSVGSAGAVSKDLQAVFKGEPLEALLEYMFDSDGVASLKPAKVVPALTALRKPKLSRRSLQSNRHGYKIFSIFSPSWRPEGYQPAIIGSTAWSSASGTRQRLNHWPHGR